MPASDLGETPPAISIVIPVYNEEAILHSAVVDLRERLTRVGFRYEILLAENGSQDGTVAMAAELSSRYPDVVAFSIGEPNYGKALREGILRARGAIVICEEIDLCDVRFHEDAVRILESGQADLVIGSKLLRTSQDDRPLSRHAASLVYNGLLKVLLGFRGTDTHGLKAFRRETLLPTVRACLVDRDVFASELVIRADRGGIVTREIPVRVMEKRPPSIRLGRRVPAVVKQLAKLTWSIRVGASLRGRRRAPDR
jgi:glycosyltransferase involved in cell wall biosynthesis